MVRMAPDLAGILSLRPPLLQDREARAVVGPLTLPWVLKGTTSRPDRLAQVSLETKPEKSHDLIGFALG